MRLLLATLILFVSIATSASDNYTIGARSAAMGHSSVSFFDMWSAFNNQAGLAFVEGYSAGFYYENKFLVEETGLKAGVVVAPFKFGTFAFSVTSFGYSDYSENKFGLAYSMKLAKNFSVGIQLDYLLNSFASLYGSNGAFTVEFGLLAKPFKGLTIAAHVYNPVRAKIADYNDERAPTILRFGANYSFSDKVLISFEVEKDIERPISIRAGLEYHIIEMLYIRAGVTSEPFIGSFGFGINYKKFAFDISAGYHTILGFSPQAAFSYRFAK